MSDIHLLSKMRQYFESGATRKYAFRIEQLKKLKHALLKFEKPLQEALYTDLKKSVEESWVTETGFLITETDHAIQNLKNWMADEAVKTNLLNFYSKSYIIKEPLGVVLVIGPWNYPLQLLFAPMIGAIAAGNCVVLKPSELAPATSYVLKQLIEETFCNEFISLIEGDGSVVIPAMMNDFTFDHVFYTGNGNVGKIIYEMAAKKLVPVTLELGGKSPCIVESDADIKVAARRIAVTKFSNAGQMCVAPDYLLVHASVRDLFIEEMKKTLLQFFGTNAEENKSYCKIINEKHFDRLSSYLQEGEIIFGGRIDKEKLFIEPTLLEQVSTESEVMREEIFGPILPIITFNRFEEAATIINKLRNPLSLSVFTRDKKKEQQWLRSFSFGGGCVNNASWHLTNYHLPFGGIGASGTGSYHGRYSFETFTHKKAIMKTANWFDPNFKYPPFNGRLGFFKWITKVSGYIEHFSW